MTASLASGVGHGTLTFNTDGSFTYVPNAGYVGSDSFTYHVSDGLAYGNTATVNFNVHSSNSAPVGVADSYGVDLNDSLTVPLANGLLANDSDPDSDPLTASVVTSTSHGTLTLSGNG